MTDTERKLLVRLAVLHATWEQDQGFDVSARGTLLLSDVVEAEALRRVDRDRAEDRENGR